MADFDLEQLRNIMQNLGDRLANTKGDEATVERLGAIESAVRDLNRRIAEGNPSDSAKRKDSREFIKELLEGLDKSDVFEGLETAIRENGSGGGQGMLNLGDLGEKGLASKVSAIGGILGGAAKQFDQFAGNLITKGTQLNGSMSGLAGAVGFNSGLIAASAKIIDDNIDSYRAIRNSAEGTIGSIQDMRRVLATTNLNIRQFADAIAKGSDGVRLLGANDWAKFHTSFKKVTAEFGYFGMTNAQIIEAQSEYLESLRERGQIFDRSDKDMVTGLQALLEINGKMANIMGKNRDDMLKELARDNLDANTKMTVAGLNLDSDAVNVLLNSMAALGPAAQQAALDILDTGAPQSDESKAIIAATGQAGEALYAMMMDIREGTLKDSDAMMNRFYGLIDATDAEYERLAASGDAAVFGALGRLGATGFGDVNEFLTSSQRLRDPFAEPGDESYSPNAGIQETDEGTIAALKVEQTIMEVSSMFESAISTMIIPTLDRFGETLNSAITALGGPKGFIAQINDSIQNFWDFGNALELVGLGLAAALGVSMLSGMLVNAVSGMILKGAGVLFSSLGTGFGNLLGGLGGRAVTTAGTAAATTAAGTGGGSALGAAAGTALKLAGGTVGAYLAMTGEVGAGEDDLVRAREQDWNIRTQLNDISNPGQPLRWDESNPTQQITGLTDGANFDRLVDMLGIDPSDPRLATIIEESAIQGSNLAMTNMASPLASEIVNAMGLDPATLTNSNLTGYMDAISGQSTAKTKSSESDSVALGTQFDEAMQSLQNTMSAELTRNNELLENIQKILTDMLSNQRNGGDVDRAGYEALIRLQEETNRAAKTKTQPFP